MTAFVAGSGTAGRTYREMFERSQPIVERLFDASHNLRDFRAAIFEDETLLPAARYLGGPPVSNDDLKTLSGGPLSRRRLSDEEVAGQVAAVLKSAWDPIRFPWLRDDRDPTPHERSTAILWTTGIWAIEQTRTRLRNESSRRQEDATAALLLKSGFKELGGIRMIQSQDDIQRGQFARRVNLGGSNADLAVRLGDGRILALECKVSNSAVNSIKRLLHETGHKAGEWNDLFGRQVVCGAVLAGVYKLGNLVDAQKNYRVTVFWEHNLRPLAKFLDATR